MLSKALLEERSFTIGLAASTPNAPWPNVKIRYCFNNKSARNALKDAVVAAQRIWGDAALNERVFKIEEVRGSQCDSDRANILLFHYNTDRVLATSVGKIPANPARGIDGPQSFLSVVPLSRI
jgi:hypothetical protein